MARKKVDDSGRAGPANDRFVLYTDGGARGNPGPAAAAIVLEDATGKTVHSAARFLGRATNNVAEYQAMILGLQEALDRGVSRLTVRSDSELVVRQISGQYSVKSQSLRPLLAEVKQLLGQFRQVDVQHVRRNKNSRADALVQRCVDAQAGIVEAPGAAPPPPPEVFTAVCTAEGWHECPGVVSAGGAWPFDGTTPAGLCLHAAAGILAAVHAAAGETLTARCANPQCSATFSITVRG